MPEGRFMDSFTGDEHTLDTVRQRFLGGTTNHWGGFCRPLSPAELEARSLGVTGWPITRGELDPWYAAAQEVIQLGPYQYDAGWWEANHDLTTLIHGGLVDTAVVQLAPGEMDGYRFGRVYRDFLEAADDVRVYLYANVVEIVATPESDRIEAVRTATLD